MGFGAVFFTNPGYEWVDLLFKFNFTFLQETMDACLCDQRRAWEMRPDGRYQLLGVGSMKKPPRKHIPEAASAKLITTVEQMGLHEGLMETVAKRCRKAKKVNLRKKDGSVQKWKNKDGN